MRIWAANWLLHGVIFGDFGMVLVLKAVIPLLSVLSQSQARRPSDRASVASECLVTLWVSGWPHMNVFLFIFSS